MLLKIFTVFDQKAKAYLPPFYMQNEGMAIRALTDSVRDPEHQFGKFAEDYTLYTLGEFDDSTSIIKQFKEAPVLVETCLAIKASLQNDRQQEFEAIHKVLENSHD